MKCCNQNHHTAFCPHCGRPLESSPLQEVVNLLRTKYLTANTYSEKPGSHPSWKEKAVKAKARLDAVEALIATVEK